MHGRLSSFQKTMLQWDDLHPYNAVHAVRLRGSLAPDRLSEVLNKALTERGLTGLSISRRDGLYTYRGGPARSQVRILPAGKDGLAGFVEEVERQLNTPFRAPDAETFEPFRFFVVPEAKAFWLGLVYFHPIADAESVLWLLKGLVEAVHERTGSEEDVSLERYPRRPESLALRRPTTYLRALASMPGSIGGTRHACRAPVRDPADGHNGIRFFSLSSDCLETLRQVGRSWGVTFNDLVLAALLQALSPLSQNRRHARKRRQIGLGIIVNLRKDLALPRPGPFGLFLGSFRVGHEVPEGMPLQELAMAVGRQTRQAKRSRCYLSTSTQLSLARFVFMQFSPERRLRFYPKHYPLWGGVTNMNLNTLWKLEPGEGTLDYLRAVSTGPATPMVLSCTTVRNRVNLGLSYRTTVFSRSDVDQVRRDFSQALEELSSNS
jgi:NRPS condensation-like uncharacterized protein